MLRNLLSRHNIKKIGYFWVYVFVSFALALWIHRDILFNTHNFGRHWDWSLYSTSQLYEQYIHVFFSALKPNYLGYFDILSINLAEFILKSSILFAFKATGGVGFVTIPILNKIAIFVLLPIISCMGIWKLSSCIFKNETKEQYDYFFIVTLLANVIYTFSLLILFDIHGGALNRQISSALFPWYWYAAYSYLRSEKEKIISRHIAGIALLFLVFDISNIFFYALTSASVIFIKKQRLSKKIAHLFLLGFFTTLINAYWIHSFFIGKQLAISSILYGRWPAYENLKTSSATFTEAVFGAKTPHDLLVRTYDNNLLLYIPMLVIFGSLSLYLFQMKRPEKHKPLLSFAVLWLFFATALATGTNSLFNIHEFLYNLRIFAFVGAALRYMPNVLMLEVLLFILSAAALTKTNAYRRFHLTQVYLCFFLFFVGSHLLSNTISQNVIQTFSLNKGTNNEIGSLYDYDAHNLESIHKERLNYNVLPIPSWYSPIYHDNVYPKTSQGSLTDNFFINKGMLYTNTTPLFSSLYFEAAINNPNPLFYSFSNVGKIMFTNEEVLIDNKKNNFSKSWVGHAVQNANRQTDTLIDLTNSPVYYPHVYSPKYIQTLNVPLKYLFSSIGTVGAEKVPFAVALTWQNESTDVERIAKKPLSQAQLEYRKVSETKYVIVAHNVNKPFVIIISQAFQPGWKLSLQNPSIPFSKEPTDLSGYKILSGNASTQATDEEVKQYIHNGEISTLGTRSSRSIHEVRYDGSGREHALAKEDYTIDYISKKMYSTIQNDNLPNISSSDTSSALPNTTHFKVNGYANGWIVEPQKLCQKIQNCSNTSQTFVFVAEFTPQKYFRYAIYVSFISILCIIFIVLFPKNEKHA